MAWLRDGFSLQCVQCYCTVVHIKVRIYFNVRTQKYILHLFTFLIHPFTSLNSVCCTSVMRHHPEKKEKVLQITCCVLSITQILHSFFKKKLPLHSHPAALWTGKSEEHFHILIKINCHSL